MDTPLFVEPDYFSFRVTDPETLEVRITDSDGEVQPLEDVQRARLSVAPRFGDPIVSDGRVEIDGDTLRYEWSRSEVTRTGVYRGLFSLETNDGPRSAPSEGFLTISIKEGV